MHIGKPAIDKRGDARSLLASIAPLHCLRTRGVHATGGSRQDMCAIIARKGKKRARVVPVGTGDPHALGIACEEKARMGKARRKPQSLEGHSVGIVDQDVGHADPALPRRDHAVERMGDKGLGQHSHAFCKGAKQGFQARVVLLGRETLFACPHGGRLALGTCDVLGGKALRTQIGKEKRALRGAKHAWGARQLMGKPAPRDNARGTTVVKVGGKAYCQLKGTVGIRRHHEHVGRRGAASQQVAHTCDKRLRLTRTGTARQDLDLGSAHD